MKVGDIRKWTRAVDPSYSLFKITHIEGDDIHYDYLLVDFSSSWGRESIEESSIPATKLDKFLHGIESEQE